MFNSPWFGSEFVSFGDLKVHFLDGGPRNGYPVLLLHGVPLWSYTYRNLIPILAEAGYRVICPDLIGFGLSTHFRDSERYSYPLQLKVLEKLIDYLGLTDLVAYGQDWGAAFALDLMTQNKQGIRGCAVSNGLPPPDGEKLPFSLKLWALFTQVSPIIPMRWIMNKGCNEKVSTEDLEAFKEPFKKSGTKSAIRAYPGWIKNPKRSEGSFTDIWDQLVTLESPVLCIFSENDNFTKGGFDYLITHIPGCQGQSHKLLPGGHFIQEDQPALLAQAIINFVQDVQSKTNL